MMMDVFQEPKFWVSAAFVVFILLVYKKAAAFIIGALDARSQRINEELKQAETLRREAEQVLAQYKQKQAEYLKEAESMLSKAKNDAALLREQAERELKLAMEARTQSAMDRIAREESRAIDEVRHHVVDIALAAARSLMAERAAKSDASDVVRLALSDIERKIH
ncbi:MAG: F0F1 ATP synthase subunit B [Alphaproteobacteria bacterium]|nr:F0F1 ATP synthase subunit B [Alphaproteobacteria bacterium]